MMAAAVLVAATPSPAFCCCSYRRPALLLSSPPLVYDPRNPKSHVQRSIPQLGLGLISPWSGLKHLGIASRRNYDRKEKKGKCRGRVVYASLFGVGAPEALVIGVVALLVFGPKGLAEVARNLGKSLRAFQPTIRELQEVSREFKSTLEREIGLDEVASSTNTYKSTSFANENQQAVVDPNGTPTAKPYTSEELLKVTEDQLVATRPQTEASNPEGQSQDGTPTAKSYTSEELLKVTEDQLAAASTRPQTEASNLEGQSQVASTTLDVAASGITTPEVAAPTPEVTVSPEAGAQIPSSKKAESER